jgi:two-component system sensor histidine kinase YesM
MPFTHADECGILTFLDSSTASGPPTLPVFIKKTSMSTLLRSSSTRLPCWSSNSGKKGFVPGILKALPASVAPPADVPVVSPSIKYAAACSAFSFATLYAVAFFVSNMILKRMKLLMKSIGKVQEGNFEFQMPIDYKDEIGRIMSAFNTMISKINNLIDDVYKTSLAEKEAKLSYLQAQMDPHFLFNALESIRMLSELKKDYEVSDALFSLSKVLKAHVNHNSFIPVKEELELIKCYICIQNIRYNNKITFMDNLDENILSLKIPALILQPIIENSIVHGFRNKRNDCIISLKAVIDRNDKKIVFEIKDNGTGISAKSLENIFDKKEYKVDKSAVLSSNGIGLHNINERISLYYGKSFGVRIKSEQTNGTFVQVILPITKSI